MTRRGFSLAFLAVSAYGQSREPAVEAAAQRVRDASRALQAGNAPLFLSYFDRKQVSEFGRLREWIWALAAQRDIASSVDIVTGEMDDGRANLQVDWIVQLTAIRQPGAVETRQESLALTFEGKSIVAVSSIELFRP